MEEWVELRDYNRNGKGKLELAFDLDFPVEKYRYDSCKERLRSLFDQLLVAFKKENSARSCIGPIPVFCGDGKAVDLFKLFWIVRKIGGYDIVSRNNLWGFVSEECGLGCKMNSSVKLIYMKYLNELDQWLNQFFSNRGSEEDELSGVVSKLNLLSEELENRFQRLSHDELEQKEQESDDEFVGDVTIGLTENDFHFSQNEKTSQHVENIVNLLSEDDEILCPGNGYSCISADGTDESILSGNLDRNGNGNLKGAEMVVNKANGFSERQSDEDVEKFSDEDCDNIDMSTKKVIEKIINKFSKCGESVADKFIHNVQDFCDNVTDQQEIHTINAAKSNDGDVMESRKRKRQSQSFTDMLSWLINVARCPNDPSIGCLPECSKLKDHRGSECWTQALLAREALQIRRHSTNPNTMQDILKDQQKKLRMHPSMYEDDVLDFRSTEKLRHSTRRLSLTNHSLCPCCISSAARQSKIVIHEEAEVSNSVEEVKNTVVGDVEEPIMSFHDHNSSDDMPAEMEVSVGPHFQAEVPEWTGMLSESDSKWLGTRMWQPEEDESNTLVTSTGEGRLHLCSCPFRNSVECVRFHIAEKRFLLRQELGLMFYHWRFDSMGEEVSLSWTEEEETKFKDMMRLSDAFSDASKFLPSKTRKNLVSYYFNVYLIQRRSYQNRATPKDIDSDDDEKECGVIGGSFGYKALCFHGSSLISCPQNMESQDVW